LHNIIKWKYFTIFHYTQIQTLINIIVVMRNANQTARTYTHDIEYIIIILSCRNCRQLLSWCVRVRKKIAAAAAVVEMCRSRTCSVRACVRACVYNCGQHGAGLVFWWRTNASAPGRPYKWRSSALKRRRAPAPPRPRPSPLIVL
jgi:hypothetical protein